MPHSRVSHSGMLSRSPGATNLPSSPMMRPAMRTPMISTMTPLSGSVVAIAPSLPRSGLRHASPSDGPRQAAWRGSAVQCGHELLAPSNVLQRRVAHGATAQPQLDRRRRPGQHTSSAHLGERNRRDRWFPQQPRLDEPEPIVRHREHVHPGSPPDPAGRRLEDHSRGAALECQPPDQECAGRVRAHQHSRQPARRTRHDPDVTTDDAPAVLAAEDRRYQAMLDGDLATLDELCADELSYTHSNAVRDTKAEYFAKLREGYYVYHRIDHPVERVELAGDAAMVVGRMTADLTSGGVGKNIDCLAIAVWTRSASGWRLLAYAPPPLPSGA